MAEPDIIDEGDAVAVCWPTIDLGAVEWWPMTAYSAEATTRPIVQDADGRIWLVEPDGDGTWREMLDGELLSRVIPIRWAVPTDEMVQALAFG